MYFLTTSQEEETKATETNQVDSKTALCNEKIPAQSIYKELFVKRNGIREMPDRRYDQSKIE
jgi:hypothetical protein